MSTMADSIIRQTLRRLASAGGESAIVKRGKESGLFPPKSTTSRATIDAMVESGSAAYEQEGENSVVRLTTVGARSLAEEVDERVLLEDFLRGLEARNLDLARIERSLAGHRNWLDCQTEVLQSLLNRDQRRRSAIVALTVLELLSSDFCNRQTNDERTSNATSLDVLYVESVKRLGPISIGQFHDSLRQLREDELIELTPWTGPLYEIPEPAAGLLIGHEISYYARRIDRHDDRRG
jgi:DNA-binding PadR family transcriptional regulator